MTTTIAALLLRTDLKCVTTATAYQSTQDRYNVSVMTTGADSKITYTYVWRTVDGALVGRVRRDIRERYGNATAHLSDGTVIGRGDVQELVVALWRHDEQAQRDHAPLAPAPGEASYDADLHSPATRDGHGNDF